MNQLKKLALVAALSLVGLSAAQAQQVVGSPTPLPLVNTTGGGTQWHFSDAAFAMDRTAGTPFIDFFMLNVPDNEVVDFTAIGNGVMFTDFVIGYAYDSVDPAVGYLGFGPDGVSSFDTGSFYLGSAYYEVDLYGYFSASNGSMSGDVNGTLAVPEPAGVGMLLAGLGLLGAIARRRKNA